MASEKDERGTTVPIYRMVGRAREEQVVDLVYHGHELLIIIRIGKWRVQKGVMSRTFKFRLIGRVNLDAAFRRAWKSREVNDV